MKFKGTKEKWNLTIPKESNGYVHIGDDGRIATCYTVNYSEDILGVSDETRANALLISKAPEMLEMLKTIVSEFSHYKSAHGTSKCGAILKAEELIEEATEI